MVGSRHMDVGRLKATRGFVFDTAGVSGAITYWAPTSVYLTITVHGKKVHAGVEPEKGINAMKVAAEAIAAMPLGRIDEETVANIGTIASGEARNVVPGEAMMEGMARSHDQAKLDAQIDAMRKAFDEAAAHHGATVDFEAEEIYRTYKIPEDALPYREAARAIRSVGIEVVPRKSGGGTDGNFFNAKGIPCVAMATGHGGRARRERAHLDRGYGHGVQDHRGARYAGTGRRRRRMRSLRRRGGIGLSLVALLSLAACGGYPERSLCAQYEDFHAAVAQLQDLDPATATADDVRAIGDDVLAELGQLQSASDDVYVSAISDLRASITAFRQAAVDLPTTDFDVARPLLQDSWDDVIVDYQVLVQRLDVACATN